MKRLALLPSLLASAALATTLLAVDVPQLSRAADLVVTATVVRSTARLTRDGARIITDTELKVSEVLKGTAPATVVVMQPGGIVGDVGQKVEGTATFTVGEEVLVFLERRGTERFAVAGMIQGKFTLARSSDGKATFAIPGRGSEAMFVDPSTHQEVSSALKTMPLEALKTQIRTALTP